MAAAEPGGWFLPVVFAIATGMPVVIAAWVLAYSAAGVGLFYGRMQIIRKWLARTVGMLFIAVGIYYWIIYFSKKIMKKEDELKELVKRRYDELALNSDSLKCGCCRSTAPAQPSQNVLPS